MKMALQWKNKMRIACMTCSMGAHLRRSMPSGLSRRSCLKILHPRMRHSSIIEASRYSNELLPLKSDIYRNGSSVYSNFKNLVLSKEVSIPKVCSEECGVLSEIHAVWWVVTEGLQFNLSIHRFDLGTTEMLSNFSTCVRFVKVFQPVRGIFNSKIQNCLLVVTESDAIIYGIESDTHSIINTDFSCKLCSRVTCVEINHGCIFLGCADGNVYQAIYKSIDLLNYKYLNLYSPGNTILKSITGIFRKRPQKIARISVGERYLVSLSDRLEVFKIEGGMYRVSAIELEGHGYIGVQIVEEDPLLFWCVCTNGARDFFSTEKFFSLDPAVVESSDGEKIVLSTPTRFLSIKKTYERSTLVLSSFNEDQLRNFSRARPVGNYEVVSIFQHVLSADLSDKSLYVLTEDRVIHFSILDSKKFLLNCRPQEIYMMFKNYGDVEFMVKYYELLTENEDTSKLEGLCKNESARNHALFVWIYTLIKPVWTVDLYSLKSSDPLVEPEVDVSVLDGIVKKLRILRSRIGQGCESALEFIDEFIQTNFYASLLADYNITFSETFESILTKDTDFKKTTLKSLLDVFTLNQSIEPLIKTMQNNCPMYLPLDQINMQRGLQLIKKDDKDSLVRSLEYLTQTKFDPSVVAKFNEIGFFYGSVVLIKNSFDFDYESAVQLFRQSVRCKKALDLALGDTRESFLYPLFEAIMDLSEFSPCVCCEAKEGMIDLVKIDNPLFVVFLKDNQGRNEKVYNLYWKYLLYRDRKVEAIEALLNLSQRSGIPLEQKVDFLHTALSISTGTHLNAEVKLRLKLYDIQKELMTREPAMRTSQLLDANTLFNDYSYRHPDLSIKILDAINFRDEKVLRELYSKLFSGRSLRDCVIFLREIANKDLGLVIDLLVDKDCEDLCASLEQAGFQYEEIIQNVTNVLRGVTHPDIKVSLLKSLRRFSKFGEFKEWESYCEKTFGIRIYK